MSFFFFFFFFFSLVVNVEGVPLERHSRPPTGVG
jgi:hypothetical protein